MNSKRFDNPILKNCGDDVLISHNVEIRRPNLVSIGSHVAIDWGFYCTSALELGDYIHIGPHVTCIGGVKGILTCKGFNNIMAGARIITVSDRFDGSGLFGSMIPERYHGRLIEKPVIMEPFSNIGTNAVVLPGSYLAMGVLITIGSVIMGETEPWTVYKGNPAKPVKKINGERLIKYAGEMGYSFSEDRKEI
ncbi:MAG: transferase hexapeptide repeat containing protein [uncultured bacterium]|nr:MAG: transferase hexapeptide repeat containing protein [uncultured bacterium]